jgi:LuxR family transcriptional regulator, maltose regulon positive regulatory protein
MTNLRSGVTHAADVRSGGLLATKLVPPLPRWQPVRRPRLLSLLEAGTCGPLTVLAAPAGAGKTMLLVSWVADGQPPGPVAWVTVDRGDEDPARFWAHVLAALREGGALPPEGLLAGLATPHRNVDQEFLVVLVNGLAELPGPVVLVLDLQEATSPGVAAGLEFVLRHAPPQLRLVVAARADPPVSLHRLRVAGQLTEIRAAELAFTPDEAGELLAGVGVRLQDGQLQSLWERTEGWAAGLRLAALSLRDHPDAGRFVAEFAGDDRAVAAYLLEEVLARQPPEVQEFLLRTCVADRLCGGLADALTGRLDGERVLAMLEHHQVFTTGLGPSRSWYRYHPLFSELLRAELRHRWPGEVPELHRRAAAWHADNGLAEEAVHHTLAAGDLDGAAGLLAAHGFAMLLDGRAESLRELSGRLPVGGVQVDRELPLVAAASRLVLGELEEADAWLELADTAGPSGTRPPRSQAAGSLAGLLRARLHGDVDGVRSTAHRLLASPPEAEREDRVAEADRRALVLSLLGAAELWSGRLDDAAAHLEQGRALAERGGRDHLALDAIGHMALLEAVRGNLARAHRLGRQAADVAGRRGWSASAQAACGELGLAWVAYRRDDLAGALDALERAARAAHAGRDRPVVLAVALAEARMAAGGDREDAIDGLARLRAAVGEAARWRPPQLLAAAVRPVEARLLLAAGDEAGAAALLGDPANGGARPAAETVVLARLQLAQGDPAAAVETLAPLHGGQTPAPRPPTLIEAWLLDAVAHRRLVDHEAASHALERALALAAPEGYRRVFVEGGAPVRAMLAERLQHGTEHRVLTEALLEGLLTPVTEPVATGGGGTAPPSVPEPVESLSERERVVLRYLPSMLSAGEIAAELYVSVNTVKTHIKSIYRKLDANRRWDAVRRARQLHLL